MHVICVGISHHTAPLALRERLAMSPAQADELLTTLAERYEHAEMAVLSTCNRTELYVARPLHGHPRIEQLVDALGDRAGASADELMPVVYHYDNERAIRHLFRVTAGLDSMAVGENQIVSQVKAAYDAAQRAETAGRAIHRIFQLALATSKRVRSETGVGDGRVSVAGVAVEFAGHLFDTLDDKRVLAIGAGEMCELAVGQFAARGAGQLVTTSRTMERAEQLAGRAGGVAKPIDELETLLAESDIVISSTSATEPVVDVKLMKRVMKKRRHQSIFVLDLALPRDFDPRAGDLANVFLFNLDDLQRALGESDSARQASVGQAELIIEQAVGEAYALVQTGDAAELIRRLRRHFQRIGQAESGRTLNKLAAADPTNPDEYERILDEHTHRLINKLLHRPLSELNRGSSKQTSLYATALRRLFDPEAEDLELPERTAREAQNRDRPDPTN